MRRLRPFGKFLCCYLPGLGGAVLLGRLAAPSAPALAPLVLVSAGFLAFAVAVSVAVSVAATPRARRGRTGGDGPVLAMLSIRRHRRRHATGFALAGAAGGAAALRLSGDGLAAGLTVWPMAGHLLLSVAVLFVAAWLIIGETACSQEAIRRALLDEVERT